jgi:hypothetical protein
MCILHYEEHFVIVRLSHMAKANLLYQSHTYIYTHTHTHTHTLKNVTPAVFSIKYPIYKLQDGYIYLSQRKENLEMLILRYCLRITLLGYTYSMHITR